MSTLLATQRLSTFEQLRDAVQAREAAATVLAEECGHLHKQCAEHDEQMRRITADCQTNLEAAQKAERELAEARAQLAACHEKLGIARRLDDQRCKELAEARKALESYRNLAASLLWLVDHVDWSNGNTDPTGSTDEGLVMHGRFMERLDHALLRELRGGHLK